MGKQHLEACLSLSRVGLEREAKRKASISGGPHQNPHVLGEKGEHPHKLV